jgi:hypothetical protein
MSEPMHLIPPIMKSEMDRVKNGVLKKDRDFFAVFDGDEGAGKSVLAMQYAKYLDPEFNLDKVVFNAEDFMRKVKDPNTKKGSCILLDEAFNTANSRSTMTEVNRAMVGMGTEMRQRNLFILMAIPSFFDLDKYFALWRTRVLFHVYLTPEEDRRYIVFPKSQKKYLYINGKKFYSYKKPKSPFPPFSFPKYYTIDELAYRMKKDNAFAIRPKVTRQMERWKAQRDAFITFLHLRFKLTQKEIGKILLEFGLPEMPRTTIENIIESVTNKEKEGDALENEGLIGTKRPLLLNSFRNGSNNIVGEKPPQ